MNKIFYINYNRFEELKNKERAIGVIVDTREMGENEFDKFMFQYVNDELPHGDKIESFIIKMPFLPDAADAMPVDKNLHYMFTNEEKYRKEISELPKAFLKQVIGNKICNTGVDIVFYRAIGVTSVQIGSPLINDIDALKNIAKDARWTLYNTPNYNQIWGDAVDLSWIRPEGIEIYDGVVDNFLLMSSPDMDINSIVGAYRSGGWLGDLKDFLVNFNVDNNPYRNQMNLFSPTFDALKSVCGDNVAHIESLKREFELSTMITEGKRRDD